MDIKDLKNKRTALINELKAMEVKLTTEKRASFSADEKAAFEKAKADLQSVKESIDLIEVNAAEEAEEAERKLKANPTATKRSINDAFGDTLREFRNTTFSIPMEEFEQRATVTTSSNPNWKFTDMASEVSVNEPELVLEALGGRVAFFKEGNVDYPNLSHIVGTFGTEDNSVSDQTLTNGKTNLQGEFVSASIEVSKKFITQSKKKNIDELKNALVYAVKKAVEKRALAHLVYATGSTGTVTGTTSFNRAIHAESLAIGLGSGVIAGTNAVKRMKQERIDSGSGIMTWTNNEVNGYPAKRSLLTPTVNSVFYGDFSSVVQAYFGDELSIQIITDSTMARKGNVLLIASCLADAKCIDFSKMTSFTAA